MKATYDSSLKHFTYVEFVPKIGDSIKLPGYDTGSPTYSSEDPKYANKQCLTGISMGFISTDTNVRKLSTLQLTFLNNAGAPADDMLPAIIGGAVGGALALIIIIVLVCCCCKKKGDSVGDKEGLEMQPGVNSLPEESGKVTVEPKEEAA